MFNTPVRCCFLAIFAIAIVIYGCGTDPPVPPSTEDRTPPTVASTSPVTDQTAVPLGVVITATFSEALEATTVKTTSFLVVGVTGTVGYSDKTASFTPDAPLDSNTVYTATLTTAITDVAGNPLDEDYEWSFRTISSQENQKPIADAGADRDVDVSSTVHLDGSLSSDPEGETLTFTWTQVNGPDVTGGQGFLTGETPTFTAPGEVSTVIFDLVVNDGVSDSDPSRLQINVMEDAANAVFVSSDGDDGNPGTRDLPFRTLQKGIGDASPSGADVYIANGVFSIATTVGLADGVSIYGGFVRTGWVRTGSDTTTINVASATAMSADAISAQTILDGLKIQSADSPNPSGTVYAMRVKNSFGLVIRHCVIRAGKGGDGTDATPHTGSAGAGGNGFLGQPGCENSSGFCGSCSQPRGGSGGPSPVGEVGGRGGDARGGTNIGLPGSPGSGGASGGTGTPPRRGDWNPAPDHVGQDGASGTGGLSGGAGFEGGYGENGYSNLNGEDGENGSHGRGGGGGGGGGGGDSGCDSYGGAGAGGGGGGGRGAGGGGGTSGGGSFALYLWSSDIRVENCLLFTRGAGDGGAAAAGQTGGAGGFGAWTAKPNQGNLYGGSGEQDDGSNGGRGGNGGTGGNGGHGGGGAGGPSIGLVTAGGSNPVLVSLSYEIGTAGTGGSSPGAPGPAGRRTNQWTP